MLKKPEQGWAIVDASSDALMVTDYRMPIYWHRHIAVGVAEENGWKHEGHDRAVRICKVSIKQAS